VSIRRYRHGRPTIGVLAGWHAYEGTLHSFLGQVFRGILAAARDRECNLLLACGVGPGEVGVGRPAWPVLSPETDFVPVGPWNSDGLIAVPPFTFGTETQPAWGYRTIQDWIDRGLPVVFAGSGKRGPAVVPDNESGIRQALAHLMAHGHRRIAFIAGAEDDLHGDGGRRLRAYRSAAREWELELDPRLVAYGDHNLRGGQRAMRRIIEAGARFTAVLASNDESAIGALNALRDAGLVVPQDVALIGFDDRLEARAQVPPLTTVHLPIFELGYQALTLLLEHIEGEARDVEFVPVPTRLVVRESCGCLPGVGPAPFPEGPWQQQAEQAGSGQLAPSRIARDMAGAVYNEMQRLSLDEVAYLCQRLLEAFTLSLRQGDAMAFRLTTRQILQRVSSQGDDLHAWQTALSILRERTPALLAASPRALGQQQAEDMLHRARVAISQVARGQYTRHLIRQASVTDHMGRMTARFLAARDEAEIFEVLAECLPSVGIQRADVAFYEAEGEDPVAWSVLPSPREGEPRRFPSRAFPPDGLYPEDEPFRLALLPLLLQEDAFGFVAFDAGNLEPCADIARQLAAALRGVRLYREAVEARRLAEEANRLKSRFLSMVSHELRTPLNLISGLSDMLLREGEQTQADHRVVRREDVERIYVSAQHLDGLIRDVLDLARSEVGQLRLVREPLDLAEVLNAAAIIGEQLARDKGLAWHADVPADLPRVWGDRTRLRQVVLNLINNAVKFTAQGEVALSARQEDDGVRVTVRDTGLGIPPDEQRMIFDEFRQSERTTARGYGGLGLGLAICKRLVEMHGGEIGVASSGEEGAGSAFTFTLPVLAGQPAAASAALSLAGAHRILLLAKDATGGRLLEHHLAQQGFEVETHAVGEGTDRLAWLLAGPPEAVVLDLGLASERGWEILKILKENPATQEIPVLFYALAGDEDSGAVLEMDYLTKPVGTAELAEALVRQGLLDGGSEEARKRILVVDDEPGVLEMHARVVEAQSPHYRVFRARNGLEALELIRRERPDLVLLDLRMPEMDGFGVLEAMREEEMSRNIPVIVLTGQVLTEEDMRRLNQGVASVLEKGLFSVEETLEHVRAALAHKQKLGAEARRTVLKATAYLHAHYAEPISLSDLTDYVGLGERHLDRCFRQVMGITPITYLNRYRIKQAKALLEAGDRTVTEVAREVGFSDGSYFARVFRREVGLSPRTYQRGERGG